MPSRCFRSLRCAPQVYVASRLPTGRASESSRDAFSSPWLAFIFVVAVLLVAACGDRPPTGGESADAPPAVDAKARDTLAPAPQPENRIVFLGDSITAGFGLEENQAFPAIIGRRLRAEGLSVDIVNAGVSGDTSAGGATRIDWLLQQRPDILVVGLGGNDGLRGLSPEMSESNLREILSKALAADCNPILLGLRLPPNLGPDYVSRFEAIYPRLAAELDVPLVPFMLEGVAGIAELNLADGIHPTAEGQKIVAANVIPYIRTVLLAGVDGETSAPSSDSARERQRLGAT